MAFPVRNTACSTPASAAIPKTTTKKLEDATKGLGWTTVALLVLSIVTAFFFPVIPLLLFGLAVCTATAAGGTFIASLVSKAKDFFEQTGNSINEVASNANRFLNKK